MTSLVKEVEKYVESKRDLWASSTCVSVSAKLRSVLPYISSPDLCFQAFLKERKSKYSIKTYFIIASEFERQTFGTNKFEDFLRSNHHTFRYCYQEKTRLLSVEEYDRFKTHYMNTNPRMFNLVVLMGEAGLRISEALEAKWEDFVEISGETYLKVTGKGKKQRLVPFEPKRLIKNSEERAVGSVAFRYYFKRDMKPYTPHDFRAFFATRTAQVYANQLTSKDLAMILGHESTATTDKYIRSDLSRVARVLRG